MDQADGPGMGREDCGGEVVMRAYRDKLARNKQLLILPENVAYSLFLGD